MTINDLMIIRYNYGKQEEWWQAFLRVPSINMDMKLTQ